MKAQRKDADTSKTHVAIRLKKGGAGKGTQRFEVLIKRDSYIPADKRPKDFTWSSLPAGDIVQEIFSNSAKLDVADKNVLASVFPDKSNTQIIDEILTRGDLLVSDVDRAKDTVNTGEWLTKIATLVSARAFGIPPKQEGEGDEAPGAAAGGGGKKKKKKGGAAGGDDGAAAAAAAASAAAASATPTLMRFDAATIERELKFLKWRPNYNDAEDDVNSAFLVLAKKSEALEGFLRDARLWSVDARKAAEAQEFLAALDKAAKRRPYKVLKCSTDRSGGQQLAVLVDPEIKEVEGFMPVVRERDGFDLAVQKKTHVPTSDEDNLAFFQPAAPAASAKIASQPAAAAAAAASSSSGDGGAKAAAGGKKSGGKKSKAEASAAPAPKKGGGGGGGGGGGSLADELAALGKKGSGSDSDSSDDEPKFPQMQTKRKKK